MDPKSLQIFRLQRTLSGSVVRGGGTRRQIKCSLVTILAHCRAAAGAEAEVKAGTPAQAQPHRARLVN